MTASKLEALRVSSAVEEADGTGTATTRGGVALADAVPTREALGVGVDERPPEASAVEDGLGVDDVPLCGMATTLASKPCGAGERNGAFCSDVKSKKT